MRSPLNHRPRGWAVPLVCLCLVLGSSLLALALQRTTGDRDRSVAQAWQRLQSQALAEGLLARALALSDDPRPVDGSCTPQGTGQGTGNRFVDLHLQPGARMTCQVDPLLAPMQTGWACTCGRDVIRPTFPADAQGLRAWAELQVEAAAPGLRLSSTGCLLAPPGAAGAAVSGCSGALTAGTGARVTVLLRSDGHGNWREVVGSWNDLPWVTP